MAIASRESFSGCTKTFTAPRLCAALVDRLTFGGNIIEFGTDSFRLARTCAKNGEQTEPTVHGRTLNQHAARSWRSSPGTMRHVDGQAAAVIATYLDLTDQHADGLIEALYLEGSLALGDFKARTSDIDFIAVTTDEPDSAALAALRHVHEELARRHHRPFFDGIYLTWPQVAAGPTSVHNPPASHEGRFRSTSPPETANPVTWHTLSQHAITCRGPAPSQLDIWTDSTGLSAWQNTNLDEYWLRNLTRARRLLNPSSLALLTDYGTVWTVTGIARLHYTIATDKIASKTQAAQHALNTFPQQWHPVVREALRIRTREHSKPLYTNRFRRRRDILSFGHMAITDAHRIYTDRQP